MKSQHFLKKGDKDNEEIYQIFGSRFDSKNNQHSSSLKSKSLSKLTPSVSQKSEDQTISRNEKDLNSSTKFCIEDEEESRFCQIILDYKGDENKDHKGKVRKEIKVDYFQLARLSRKFQKMKQFCNFPFIKRFKFDIKTIKEDTFLEFIKSTQGEEFKITETNYQELFYLSKEWGTYELTNILEDYGKRHESEKIHIIEQYIYLSKEYDHYKEENFGKQIFKRREKEEYNNNNYNYNYNYKDKDKITEEQKIISKIKSSQIRMVEEKMKNQIEECFKTNIFWEIRIDTIYRLIKETSKQDYSHDLLFECIIESIEERGKLIELIDPSLISESNHQKLIDLQYNFVKEMKNKQQSNQQEDYNSNIHYINMNLMIEMLQRYQSYQRYQETDYKENTKSKEINKVKRELEEKVKELKEMREREMSFCNEMKRMKEKIKEERKEVKIKEKEIKIRENEVERNIKEVKNKENENQAREEENKRNEEKIEKRNNKVEIKEKEIQEREDKVEREKYINENKEKEIIRNKKENEMKKEEIQNWEENMKEREEKIEEKRNILEREKIFLEKKMKEEEDKINEKAKQQQELIDELRNQLSQNDADIKQMKLKEMEMEMEKFLRENNLNNVDNRNYKGCEAIHIACENGNDKIVSYILSKNQNKLNARNVFISTCVY